jgi:trimeric autotransporter adhesin
LNSAYGYSGQRPNATGMSSETTGSLEQRLNSYVNPAAFSQAAQFTFGNVSRISSMRGPGQATWDMSLFKTFTIVERLSAQLRVEALNAFNTPLFNGPNTSFGSSSFGQITSQANQAREFQFCLRLFF